MSLKPLLSNTDVVTTMFDFLPVRYVLSTLPSVGKVFETAVNQKFGLIVKTIKDLGTIVEQQTLTNFNSDMFVVLKLSRATTLDDIETIMKKLLKVPKFPFPLSLQLEDVDILDKIRCLKLKNESHSEYLVWNQLLNYCFDEIRFCIERQDQYQKVVNYFARLKFPEDDFPFVSFDFAFNLQDRKLIRTQNILEYDNETIKEESNVSNQPTTDEKSTLHVTTIKKLKLKFDQIQSIDDSMRGLFENFCYIEELVLTTKYDCPLSLMGIPSTIRKLVVNCNHSKIDDEDITKFLTNTGTVLKSLELNGGFPHIFGSFLQYLPQSLECVQIFGAQNFGVLELTFNNSLKTLRYDAEVVFTRTDDSFRRYFPNTRLMINSTTPLMTEVQPEQLLAKADEQSIRNWKLYSELPLDLLNAPFTHKGEEITVCFQPIDGKSKVLLKVSDKKWIYTSNNSIPSSETSIQSSKENKEEKKGSASSDTSNGMDLSMNTQQETVSNKTKKQNLLKKYEGYKGKLSELHTHLMGMGNAHFWIEFVMKKMIPELVASNPKVPKKIDPTECNNIDDLNLESIWTLHNSIPTTDVVYGVEELFIAFQLNDPRSKEEKEAHLSSIIGGEDPHHYIVYNVREGKNVDIYGYTNSQIINNLDNNPLLKAKLIKSFEMKYPGDYNGMFSPNFYPQRFSMKDCIYFMYPKVISALLLHTIFNYCEEGVSYVEYSVSLKDLKQKSVSTYLNAHQLIEFWNDDIKHLYTESFNSHKLEYNDERKCLSVNDQDFHYYFLAALNRNSLSMFNNNLSETEKMAFCQHQLTIKMAFDKSIFKQPLEQIGTDVNGLLDSLRIEELTGTKLVETGSVVGFDWVGDEKYYAPCVFTMDIFSEIAREYHNRTQQCLGLRYHCGENIFIDKSFTYFSKHMDITFQSIKKILNHGNIKLRLGHGVGFLVSKISGNNKKSIEETKLTKSNEKSIEQIFKRMEQFRNYLCTHNICFEWCPTSNEHLLYNFHNITIPSFSENLIVATDNDGIMPVEGVMMETDKAYEKLEKIGINTTFEHLVENAKKARFINVDDTTSQLKRKCEEQNGDTLTTKRTKH